MIMALEKKYIVYHKKCVEMLINLFPNSNSPLVKVATENCCKHLTMTIFKQIAFDEK